MSLKLYLWSFRDRPVFAEALAAEIMATGRPVRHPTATLTGTVKPGLHVGTATPRARRRRRT